MTEQQTPVELPSNFDVKQEKNTLFDTLREVLSISRKKFKKQTASNSDRQKWARVIIAGVEVYAKLLETAQLEALEERLERLETGR